MSIPLEITAPAWNGLEMQLSALRFHTMFEQFKAAVRAEGGQDFVSFHHGICDDWEGYKQHIYREGRERLGFASWKRKEIGTGKILRAMISAIEINTGTLRNNLVQWQGKYGPDSRSHRSLVAALDDNQTNKCERELFALYRTDQPREEVFELLTDFAGRRYDLLAYIFFLSDWARYMPIATGTFDGAFGLLDLPLRTVKQCSWENYVQYVDVLEEIRVALTDEGLEGVRLIDAHSFCWMLSRLGGDKPASRRTNTPKYLELQNVAVAPDTSALRQQDGVASPDFEALQRKRAILGRMAEEVAYDAERRRLLALGCTEYVDSVRITSSDHRLGYDITSKEADGTDRFIEVKAVSFVGGCYEFFLTENERCQARTLANWWLYLVTLGAKPVVRALPASLLPDSALRPILYRAGLSITT